MNSFCEIKSKKNISIGIDNPVETASPSVPPNHDASKITRDTAMIGRSGNSMPPARYAWVNSRTPSMITIQISAKNNLGSKLIEPKIKVSKDNETKIDGRSLRPARLFIASLIECRSAIIKLLAVQLLYALKVHQSWLCGLP